MANKSEEAQTSYCKQLAKLATLIYLFLVPGCALFTSWFGPLVCIFYAAVVLIKGVATFNSMRWLLTTPNEKVLKFLSLALEERKHDKNKQTGYFWPYGLGDIYAPEPVKVLFEGRKLAYALIPLCLVYCFQRRGEWGPCETIQICAISATWLFCLIMQAAEGYLYFSTVGSLTEPVLNVRANSIQQRHFLEAKRFANLFFRLIFTITLVAILLPKVKTEQNGTLCPARPFISESIRAVGEVNRGFYFATTTAFTVGYGDILPTEWFHFTLLSVSHIAGYMYLGLFLGVAFRTPVDVVGQRKPDAG